MRPIITTLFVCFIKLLYAQTLTDSVSLQQIQQLASQYSVDVNTAKLRVKLADLEIDLMHSRLKPRLDLTANLPNYFSSFSETTQPDGTVAFRPITVNNSSVSLQASQAIAATGGTIFASTSLQRFDDYENKLNSYKGSPLRIGIIQPILGFNPWKWDKRIYPIIKQESDARLESTKKQAITTATNLFFDLLTAQQAYNIATVNEAASQQLLEIATERYQLGKINKGDLVQIKIELATSKQNLINAQRFLAAASQAIYTYLNIPYDGKQLAAYQPDAPPLLQVDHEVLMHHIVNSHPDFIRSIREQLESKRNLEKTKRSYGPQLDLQASIGLVRSDLNLAPIYASPQSEQIVSLQLNLPIVDWGERKKAIESSRTKLQLTQQENSYTLQAIKGQATLLLHQYKKLSGALKLAQQISQLATERLNISRESYLLGSIPLTELTLAQQTRDQLARNYLNTLSTYWNVWASLQTLINH